MNKEFLDCKNYILDETSFLYKEVSFPNVVITIILTRQCNLRCNYCWINFTDDNLSYKMIDLFLEKLLIKRNKINNIKFEFFWWEPLLEFEKIKYIVEKTKAYNIKYSIVTNGFLLDENKIFFLNKNNFEIVFSVAIHTNNFLDKEKELFKNNNLNNFIINFIIEPWKEKEMFEIFVKLIRFWFYNIIILPVHYTVKWKDKDFINLDLLLYKIQTFYKKIIHLYKNKININYLRINNIVSFYVKKNDYDLLLDYDGNFYWDYDSELRLLKDFVWKNIFDINEIFLWNLNNFNFDFLEILKIRSRIETQNLTKRILKFLKFKKNTSRLWRIIYNNNLNLNDK